MFIQVHLGVNDVRLQKLIEREVSKVYIVFGSIVYVCGNPLKIVSGRVHCTRPTTTLQVSGVP